VTPDKKLAAAQVALTDARKRLAEVRQRNRELLIEGQGVAGEIQARLFDAGQRGVDPDVADLHSRIAELQAAHTDMIRIEDGAQHGVREAENAVEAVRFEYADKFQQGCSTRRRTSPPNAADSRQS
jgi:hypothetical protein